MVPIKVTVVDDNELFALGLHACLSGKAGVEVVDSDGDQFDVAVVSPEVAARRSFGCPVVVCGDPVQVAPGNVVLATLGRAGLTAPVLLATVQAAAAGLRVAMPEEPAPARLPARNLEVLRLLAGGAATTEIARNLGYSERTIKTVIHEVQLALGARNRVQAVAEGIRQGVLAPG